MASILLSFYLVLVIVIEAFLDHGTSTTLKSGYKAGTEATKLTVFGVVNSISIVIFSFMYQVNIPALYSEMETTNLSNGKKMIFIGTALAVVLYIMAGTFGYMAFADHPDSVDIDAIFNNNILQAPFKDKDGNTPLVVYISLFGMCCVVTIATPFCILPCKDSLEEVRNKKFEGKENFMWTLALNTIGVLFALPFTTLSAPMALLGATTNSAVGFWLPIIYYLKMERKTSPWTNMKIISYIIFGLVIITSITELVLFVQQAISGDLTI